MLQTSEFHAAFRKSLVKDFPVLADETHPDWGGVPDYMRDGLARYVLDGVPPGGFLRAVLNNDMMHALERADGTNATRLLEYGRFFSNHMPASAFGYPTAVNQWCAMHRDKRAVT